MNNLQYETSPYLLQHANNPVDWYAWKPEAFAKAREENKPVLVSIGYSTCHWCHVMERESFENDQIAEFMNEHFVNIKVDREERPDVDQIYMEACQAINGSGGWPLNCFLLPDGKPFFAGTYYPPQQVHNRPSWRQLLEYLHDAFNNRRKEVEQQAKQLMDAIAGSDRLFIQKLQPESGEKQKFNEEQAEGVFKALERNFDKRYGGFGGAPKFPATMPLTFLLEYAHINGTERAKDHVVFSLEQMINGGIYDQLGGGFSRYATDRAWLVPHFEKMLYDNALLIGLLADAYQYTSIPLYKETIEETISFTLRELYKTDEGFYAALDADSEGEEGKYYVWSKKEIDQLLGSDSEAFCDYYGVTESGNWEGANILNRRMPLAIWAEKNGHTFEEAKANFKSCRATLFAARSKRIRPGLDDKILLSWNAMMVKALVKASVVLDKEAYLDIARRTMQFLLKAFRMEGEDIALYHTYKNKKGQYRAFLDDYALLIEAMITLYQADYNLEWLKWAEQYADFVIHHFLDRDDKMFYFTSSQQEDIPLRKKDAYDSAVPSGNSTMVNNLLELGILLGRADFNELAEEILDQMAGAVIKYPSSFANWARALLYKTHTYYEIAIVGPEAMWMASQMNQHYLPNSVRMVSEGAQEKIPLLKGKSEEGDTKIYVCQEYACQAPVQSVKDAISQMH